MALWEWNKKLARYRVTKEGASALGLRTGTIIGQAKMVALRDTYTAASIVETNVLSAGLASGEVNLTKFVLGMRQQVKDAYINQYLLAGGGRNAMTPADWGRIGREIRDQYGFLDKFAVDIQQGKLTAAQIQARSNQYINGSTQMFERSNALARGLPDLPQYPADGNQDCHSNCKCNWDIQDRGTSWECVWVLDAAAEHCDTCIENAGKWNPLIIKK